MIALLIAILTSTTSGIDDRKTVSTEWGVIRDVVILDGFEIRQGVTVGKVETTMEIRKWRTLTKHHRNQSYLRLGNIGIEVVFQFRADEKF